MCRLQTTSSFAAMPPQQKHTDLYQEVVKEWSNAQEQLVMQYVGYSCIEQ